MGTSSEPPSGASAREPLTNPARRLYSLLERGQFGRNPDRKIKPVLAKMFELKDNSDESEMYTKLATFLRLIATVERRCKAASDKRADQFLYAIKSVWSMFRGINLEGNWSYSAISESDMGLIYLAAAYFDEFKEEALIDPKTLAEINAGATALSEEIVSGNLDERLKVIILDQLDAIQQSVDDYKIRGAEGLKKVLAESTGMIVLEKDAFAKNKDNPTVKKFWDVLTKINTAVRGAELAHYLGDAVAEAIKSLTF